MNPPLLKVELTIHFEPTVLTGDQLRYFQGINSDLLPVSEAGDPPLVCVYHSVNRQESMLISADQVRLINTGGASFPKLRQRWTRLIESFLDVFHINAANCVSLLYLNEIELQDLRTFRDYLNISFEMPPALMERIEFFRSEFTYKYDFGEIHVWLQPDWEDATETYCIQLSLESRRVETLDKESVLSCLQNLHEGIKDAFHQILSRDFIERLPQ